MLGQLFQNLSTRRPSNLDSVTEDFHTRNLLFPDTVLDGALHTIEASSIFANTEYSQDHLDLEFPRDIRILIAQYDATKTQGRLLFDSKPPLFSSESPRPSHARSSSRSDLSNSIEVSTKPTRVPTIPEDQTRHRANNDLNTSSLIPRGGRRKGSVTSIKSFDESSTDAREIGEIQNIALSCMFQNAPTNYKGPSTKVHIVSRSAKVYENAFVASPVTSQPDVSTSFPKAYLRRPSNLSRSFVQSGLESVDQESLNLYSRRHVFVTRTFSIPWSDDEFSPNELSSSKMASPGKSPSDQLPSKTASPGKPPPFPVPKRSLRSLMFAVTIIISLPISREDNSSPSVSRTGTFNRKAGQAAAAQASALYGSSADSDKRTPWISDSLIDSLRSMSDVDDRTSIIGQHWDIFARSLTTLQYLAHEKIYKLIKFGGSKPPFKISSNILGMDRDFVRIIDETALRVIRGVKIERVQTGHGRWPAWREEAKWLSNWAGTKDQNFFFLSLLSTFLGTNNEWLYSLAPKWYRQRFQEQEKLMPVPEAALISTRTIIISKDKMAARRLIFLLSAFLPPNPMFGNDVSLLRPGTANTWRTYSQSPPKHTLSRQEPLIRTINNLRAKRSSFVTPSDTKSRSSSIVIIDSNEDFLMQSPPDRRESDARSSRSKLYLSTDNDANLSQGSKAETTTSAAIAGPIVVRPHFSRYSSLSSPTKYGGGGHSRSNSTASMSLMQPLQSNQSSPTSESWGARWNPLRNLWGGQRRDSNEFEILQSTDEGHGILDKRFDFQMQKMVDDVVGVTGDAQLFGSTHGLRREYSNPMLIGAMSPDPGAEDSSPPKSFSKPIDVPLKVSINPDDGIIDVHIPFLSSTPTPTQSSSSPISPLAGSAFIHSQSHSHNIPLLPPPSAPQFILPPARPSNTTAGGSTTQAPPNAAGWLPRIHQDFALQATKPYAALGNDIRDALAAEPTPPIPPASLTDEMKYRGPVEGDMSGSDFLPQIPDDGIWVTVGSAIIADADSWSIKKVTLKRKVRFVKLASVALGNRGVYGNPYAEPELVGRGAANLVEVRMEEKFEEFIISPSPAVSTKDADEIAWDPALKEVISRMCDLDPPAIKKRPSRGRDKSRDTDAQQQQKQDQQQQQPPKEPAPTPLPSTTSSSSLSSTSAHSSASSSSPTAVLTFLEDLVAQLATASRTASESGLRAGIRRWLYRVEARATSLAAATAVAAERERVAELARSRGKGKGVLKKVSAVGAVGAGFGSGSGSAGSGSAAGTGTGTGSGSGVGTGFVKSYGKGREKKGVTWEGDVGGMETVGGSVNG